jgi:hypothetical protein
LPSQLKASLSKLNRFHHLEIGDSKPASASSAAGRILCRHCGQGNEGGRELCWACYKPVVPPQQAPKPDPDQEIAVVVNGRTFRSGEPDIPEDVKVLMSWIREEGYTEALMDKWQRYVKGRVRQVEAIQGQRVSVLRIDGKLYKSDDPDLPEEIKDLFTYIERDGVTPALLQHLRLYGTLVKYRPPTTPNPSDGDMNFWKEAWKALRKK